MSNPQTSTTKTAQRYQQLIAGFNVYRTASLRDALAPLRVTTCVRGLVVDGEARVVSADTCGVVFNVGRPQLNALVDTGFGIVASPVHGASYRARVDDANTERKLVSLSHFEPYRDHTERRATSRVVPEDPMLVRVTRGEREASGRVVDISVSALAARFDTAAADHLDAKDEVHLQVWGQEVGKRSLSDFEVTARVLRARTEDEDARARHVVFVLESYVSLDRRLGAYVAARQHRLMVALAQAQS